MRHCAAILCKIKKGLGIPPTGQRGQAIDKKPSVNSVALLGYDYMMIAQLFDPVALEGPQVVRLAQLIAYLFKDSPVSLFAVVAYLSLKIAH